jgi:hypothetical protein
MMPDDPEFDDAYDWQESPTLVSVDSDGFTVLESEEWEFIFSPEEWDDAVRIVERARLERRGAMQ